MPKQKQKSGTRRRRTRKRRQAKSKENEYPSFLSWLRTPVLTPPDIGIALRQKGGSKKQQAILSVEWPLVAASKTFPPASVTSIKQRPRISWSGIQPFPITLLCWNPDTETLHICETNLTDNKGTGGIQQVDWIAPESKPVGEENRLFFAVLAQKQGIPTWEPITNRNNFPVRAFIEKNGLELLDWVAIRINST